LVRRARRVAVGGRRDAPAPGTPRRLALTRRLVAVALLGAALAAVFEIVSIVKSEQFVPAHGPAYVTTFEEVPTSLDFLLAQSDGQFYAAIAEDPLLRHPERWKPGAGEIAYRWQRPALPYLAWLLSFGHPRTALAVAVVLSAGAAAALCGALLQKRSPVLGVAVLLLPGSLIALRGFGPELLALAFAAAALHATERERYALAAVLLCFAALSRESLTLAGLALGAHTLSTRRAVRPALMLALAPMLALGAWWAVVHARVHAWPWDAANDRLATPLTGLIAGIRDWSSPLDAIFALAVLAIATAALIRGRRDAAAWIAVAYVPFAFVMGWDVWRTWQSFGRPLLPLFAFGLIAAARASTVAQRFDRE
jgi:hypothetical protein